MKSLILILLFGLAFSQVPDFNEVCVHNPYSYSTNQSSILLFFNGCLRVSQENQIIINLSKLVIEWLEPTKYCELLFILLFSLPYLYDAFNQASEKGLMARYGHYILEISLFLFRISFVYSIQTWLYCIFRQTTPCLCQMGREIRYLPITQVPWGMPSGYIMTSTILGLHFIERIDIIIGILIIFFNFLAQIFIGYNSIGQVITGLVFGVILHFYLTRTPLFMRIVDVIINVILGVPIFLLVGVSFDILTKAFL